MKCIKCGANYKTRELRCPYCYTENKQGKIWKSEKETAEKNYIDEKNRVYDQALPYVVDRVLSKSINILLKACGIVVMTLVILSASREEFRACVLDCQHDGIIEELQKLYDEERFDEMYSYIADKKLPQGEYVEYRQACELYKVYEKYMSGRLAFFELSEEEMRKDDGELYDSVVYAVELIEFPSWRAGELMDINEGLHEKYKLEAEAYLLGVLMMTDDEIESLLNYSLSGDETRAFVEEIKERVIGKIYGE